MQALRRLLVAKKFADSTAYIPYLLTLEKDYKEAELAQRQQPIDETKFTIAEASTRKAITTVGYLATHYSPAAQDTTALLREYKDLLKQLQQFRPVRWTHPPFYLKYQWQRDKRQKMNNDGNVYLTHREWQRTPIDLSGEGLHIKDFNLPIFDGLTHLTWAAFDGWMSLLGWLLTGLAMMVGAPFWFDLLCRFVNIRNVGIKPPKTSTP